MAKLLDPRNLPAQTTPLPGMKPAVRDFAPADDCDPDKNVTASVLRLQFADEKPWKELTLGV